MYVFLYVHMSSHGYKLIEYYIEKYYIEYRAKKLISHHSQTATTASMSNNAHLQNQTNNVQNPTYIVLDSTFVVRQGEQSVVKHRNAKCAQLT